MNNYNLGIILYSFLHLHIKIKKENRINVWTNSLKLKAKYFYRKAKLLSNINDLKKACKKNTPEIRIATPYFKPSKNKTDRKPNYYIHETDKWLVFPHELDGLTVKELKENKPELGNLLDKIANIIEKN